MTVSYLGLEGACEVVDIYNQGIDGLPGVYALSPEQFTEHIQRDMEWFDGRSTRELENEQLLIWREGGCVVGFTHVATLDRQRDGRSQRDGLIRFLDFRASQRHAGQALIVAAEQFLLQAGAQRILAFPKSYIYRFFSPDGGIPEKYGHVTGLLGANDYNVSQRTMTMTWANFEVKEPILPDVDVQVRVKKTGAQTAPQGLLIKLCTSDADENASFGMCIAYSLRTLQPSEQGRADLFIQWLVVDEARRGQGWGRYLMQCTLWEAQRLGYRNTILVTSEGNHRAIMLYSSLGYHVVQTSYAFTKTLPD